LDGEFLKRCEVEVKLVDIEMIEKNFKRAYWKWELTAAYREKITVCKTQMHICAYIKT